MLDHHHHHTEPTPNTFTPANAGASQHHHASPTFSVSSHSAQSSSSPTNTANTGSSSNNRTTTAHVGEPEDTAAKRQRNTMAARRYRQRRLDRLAELEQKLAEMTADRDDLRVQLARREAEVGALREVINAGKR